MDEFWHVLYRLRGEDWTWSYIAENEEHAHTAARGLSMNHGTATISSHNGFVARYINGVQTFLKGSS